MRVHAIPHSTNVQRVALALGLKGIAVGEWVQHPPEDRAGVRAVSGQDLVPVVETDDGRILTDSMPIVAWIDATWPEPAPLYPADAAPRREVEAFIAFFDFVWKVPPNAIEAERRKPDPDAAHIDAWVAQLHGWQHGFDALLVNRPYLFGETPGAADICAYPFLRFTTSSDPDDDDLFHGVLIEHLAPAPGRHRNLAAWIDRMAQLPQA
ncbi:MAG TPA: glutathione S-transferase family protein [Baekduia sp.]|nr:glutathione S-transferase family protein [Baekduia sp.]